MRFAICVAGDLRGFASLAWSFERRLIAPTLTAGAAVDCFFHVWSDGSALEAEGELRARKLACLVGVVIEPKRQWANLTKATYGWSPTASIDGSAGGMEAFRSQWRKVHLAVAMALNHAASTSKQSATYYDAYIRTRPDMLHLAAHNLAAEHLRMSRLAAALGSGRTDNGAEYVAMQHCLAPWPLPAPDAWWVATPKAAVSLAELPRKSEPGCCEHWMKHRLQAMGVAELPPEEAASDRISAAPRPCVRGQLVTLQKGKTRMSYPLLFSELHALFMGGRCFLPKLVKKKRLSDNAPNCVPNKAPTARLENLAAAVALRPPSLDDESGHPVEPERETEATLSALRYLLERNATDYFRLHKLIRHSACRCALGGAVPVGGGLAPLGS